VEINFGGLFALIGWSYVELCDGCKREEKFMKFQIKMSIEKSILKINLIPEKFQN
jgi:hypothetical protein